MQEYMSLPACSHHQTYDNFFFQCSTLKFFLLLDCSWVGVLSSCTVSYCSPAWKTSNNFIPIPFFYTGWDFLWHIWHLKAAHLHICSWGRAHISLCAWQFTQIQGFIRFISRYSASHVVLHTLQFTNCYDGCSEGGQQLLWLVCGQKKPKIACEESVLFD